MKSTGGRAKGIQGAPMNQNKLQHKCAQYSEGYNLQTDPVNCLFRRMVKAGAFSKCFPGTICTRSLLRS